MADAEHLPKMSVISMSRRISIASDDTSKYGNDIFLVTNVGDTL